jgi:sporulation protein YlmC with PRC-barrel domain
MIDHLIKSAEFQGKHVVGVKDVRLGTVREIFVDLSTGAVAFLLVEPPSLLGGAGKYHPVPFSAARYDLVAGEFVLAFDKETFKEAPSYDRDQLASSSYGWADQVVRYFSAL